METVDLKLVLLGEALLNVLVAGDWITLVFSVSSGQPGVGKTCLVYRYLYNTFGETISTIGASFAMKKVETESGRCTL